MGYNTTVLVLNDALHLIKDDKEFGKKVYEATLSINRPGVTMDISVFNHCNAATVIETHHADDLKMFIVGGNTAWDLGYAGNWSESPSTPEKIRKILDTVARHHGLRVVKAPKVSKSKTR